MHTATNDHGYLIHNTAEPEDVLILAAYARVERFIPPDTAWWRDFFLPYYLTGRALANTAYEGLNAELKRNGLAPLALPETGSSADMRHAPAAIKQRREDYLAEFRTLDRQQLRERESAAKERLAQLPERSDPPPAAAPARRTLRAKTAAPAGAQDCARSIPGRERPAAPTEAASDSSDAVHDSLVDLRRELENLRRDLQAERERADVAEQRAHDEATNRQQEAEARAAAQARAAALADERDRLLERMDGVDAERRGLLDAVTSVLTAIGQTADADDIRSRLRRLAGR